MAVGEGRNRFRGPAVADSAVVDWLDLAVKLGQVEAGEARLREIQGRDIGGSAGARVRMAAEGLWVLRYRHELAFASATLALEMVLRDRQPESYQLPAVLTHYHPSPAGTSLTEVRELARAVRLEWRMAYREGRQADFVVPSIVHLRSGHYSALLRAEGDRYLLRVYAPAPGMWAVPGGTG